MLPGVPLLPELQPLYAARSLSNDFESVLRVSVATVLRETD